MKKMMYFAPFAALALVACSSDSVVENSVNPNSLAGSELALRPVVSGATRGTVLTDANISSFHVIANGTWWTNADNADGAVTGLDANVTKESGKWVLVGGNKYWWPGKSAEAKFQAYSPADQTIGSNIEIPSDITAQQDIAVAFNQGVASEFAAGVPLAFKHVTSQIVVNAKNSDPSDIEISVAGAKLMNVNSEGALSLPDAASDGSFDWTGYTPWSVTANSGKNFVQGDGAAAVTSGTVLSRATTDLFSEPMFLLPQQLTAANLTAANVTGNYIAVLVHVVDKTKEVPAIDMEGRFLTKDDGTAITDDFTEGAVDTETGIKAPGTYADCTFYDADKNELTGDFDREAIRYILKSTESNVDNAVEVKVINPVVFPKVGASNNTELYAYVAQPINTLWEYGYKYTYTLNFSKSGCGKTDPDLATTTVDDKYNYPYGTGDGALKPGEDIKDESVPLLFNVTVEKWNDAAAENVDM